MLRRDNEGRWSRIRDRWPELGELYEERASRSHFTRWRAKKHSELSISNPGTSMWPSGLACGVFPAQPMASNSASPDPHGTISWALENELDGNSDPGGGLG